MYIWRGKNRRDKRNLLLGGDLFWGAEKGAKNLAHEDNALRVELEQAHVSYYGSKVKALMIQYLSTPNGRREVELLVAELEKNAQFNSMLSISDSEEENETLKRNIFDIFKEFCLPETTYIDREGLKKLFSDLQLTMSKREFDTYVKKLNLHDKAAAVDFDGFFDVLMESLRGDTAAKSTSFIFFKKSEETLEKEKNGSLSYKVQRRLQENAAKLILIDHAVHTVEQEALEEYRKVHPSPVTCEQCNRAFSDAHQLRIHSRHAGLHRELLRKKAAIEERFACVNVIFQGNQGRHLRANRLIHSEELGSLRARIDVAVEEPYRPNIADFGGKRYAQQMAGSMVQGYDAKCGIRPNHKRYGLLRQHLAPMRDKTNVNSLYQVTQPQLLDVIHHLLRCKDDFIDTVSTCDNPHNLRPDGQQSMDLEPLTDREGDHGPVGRTARTRRTDEEGDGELVFASTNNSHGMTAVVRFQWNGFADNQVYIIGEFTGWRKEEMVCSTRTGRFTIYKQLGPGRYRYRFVIDGVERVDDVASKVPDPKGPGGFTNEILVTNTPLYHQHLHPSVGATGVASPLQQTAIRHSLEKLGLQVPPSASDKSSAPMRTGTPGSSKRVTPALGMPGYTPTSDRSGEGSRRSAEEGDGTSEYDQRSVGEIVHISQGDKEGLIRHLKHIQLRNAALHDDGAWALASYINRNKFIQIIDLSYNNISDDGMQGFSGCLPLLEALHTLKLNGNGFAMDTCRYLTENLAASTTLTCLELANNRIGDDGMEVLCAFLKHNECLEHLYVDTCLIGDDGILCLQEALMFNRRLKSISLMSNRFTVKGMMALGKTLQYNAALTTLVLSHNPIGPEAANSIGSSLTVNDTLTRLEMANIDLLAHHSSYGLHGLCAGLKANGTLTHLDLRNNGLNDRHAVDIAHALTENETVTELPLTGNTITKIWFTDYTMIPTHILPDMPSIETQLHRNRIAARGKNRDAYDAPTSRYLDDVPKGKWTFRRQWKREAQSSKEKSELERQHAHEQSRIDAETAYIRFHLNDIMTTVREYLEQEPCRAYVRQLTKAIQQYITDLGRFDSRRYNRFNISMTDVPVVKGKNNVRSTIIKLKRSVSASASNGQTSPASRGTSPSRPLSPQRSLLLPKKPDPVQFNMEHFLNAHITVLHATFSQLNGGSSNSLILSPLLLQQALHTLALPLPLNEVQEAVDATLVRVVSAIGLHRLSDYVLSNAQRLCRENKLQRMRVLADFYFNPPALEARTVIYDHLHHATYNELRDKYRSIPEHAPMYACPECHKRFTRKKHLDKHVAKGSNSSEHRRHRMKEVIYHSQVLFLQDVKHDLTDVFFPAYYELKPSHQLPKNYYPQVFDKIGKEGRPFGVVEANRTVRVLDVFGEYLHVNLHGELGWIRYRDGKQHYLQPACANQVGFDWDKLHIQETPTYYRVNDLLPKETELKVRYQPLSDGEVVGYLRRDEVIECLAVIGDWLQVRFEKEDAAWIRWRITPGKPKPTGLLPLLAGSVAGSSSASVAPAKRVTFNPVDTLRSTLSAPLNAFSSTTFGTGSIAGASSMSVTTQSIADSIAASPVSSPGNSPTRFGRKKAHTPGEEHGQIDATYKDDLITYEINGAKTRAHLRKNPTLSREKIDHFNRVRYGSSADGSSEYTLLPLPEHFIPFITPPTPPGQVVRKPPSPLTLTQREVFDHIMSLSLEEILRTSAGAAERERNEIFFSHQQPASPTGSPARSRRRRRQQPRGAAGGLTGAGDGESGFSPMDPLSSTGFYSSASEDEGDGKGRFGVSFRDAAYGVRDEEDDVDAGLEHADSLQGYDFVAKRRNARSTLYLP